MYRKQTQQVRIGAVPIGGGAPIAIQSMCNAKNTKDIISQIHQLEEAGCEIIRIAVPDEQAAHALKEIKKQIRIPLVADIHFDYKLALKAIQQGVDKLRINPGNIGDKDRVRQVVKAAKNAGIPIRIGVNAGSLEKHILEKNGGITAEGLVESAMGHVHILEDLLFFDIVISVKTSSVPLSIAAYTKLSQITDYPLHLGITEAGSPYAGTVKSACGIGAVLAQGIGDTIRVSLTGDPTEEIRAAKKILQSMELRQFGIEVISCPTCARTNINLISIAEKVESMCQCIDKHLKVAVMGCVVNGPGEAKDADIGIAGGDGKAVLFKKGKIFKTIAESDIVTVLLEEIKNM